MTPAGDGAGVDDPVVVDEPVVDDAVAGSIC
jgi:hypothetical protein